MSELGQQEIRHLRRAIGLNASDFGALVGVSGRSVEDWEQGRRSPSGPAQKIMAQLKKQEDIIMSEIKTVNVKNAFSDLIGTYSAYADEDGTVRVWDSSAGHYTTCHNLTENQIKYVRRMATNKSA